MPAILADSITIELQLTGTADTDWVDVSADVAWDSPIRCKYGIWGFGPRRRVASPGFLSFQLDNGVTNSGSVRGYYTPGHGSARTGFVEGIGARFSITYGQAYYKFLGRLTRVQVQAGKFGGQRTICRATDFIADAAKLKPRGLTVQSSKTGDQLLTTALTASGKQPRTTNFDTGKSTFEFAFDEIRDDGTTLLQIMRNIANSELGEIAQIGDTDGGGTLRFFNRHHRVTSTSILQTFDDDGDFLDDFTALQTIDDEGGVYNTITAKSYPRAVDTDTAVVLWTLQGDNPIIGAGNSITLIGYYRDPANEDVRVGAVDLIAPAAEDVTVTGITATDLGIVATLGGNSAELVLTNNGAATATITKLQVRGSKLLVYEPALSIALDSDSIADHGDRPLQLPLRYQDNPLEAKDFADALLDSYKDDVLRANKVSFVGNQSSDLMDAVVKGEPGRRIAITDALTGFSATEFFINGVELRVSKGRIINCTFDIVEAGIASYFILDTSLLDGADVLAF